jgi:hypothetical protein
MYDSSARSSGHISFIHSSSFRWKQALRNTVIQLSIVQLLYMSVAWSESSAAADLRESIQTWSLAGLRGDALLDGFRELTTLEFLRKCSPASVHNLRLFLFDHGVGVNMRFGYSSFYAVRALLPISASELERDPERTDEDVRATNRGFWQPGKLYRYG